MQIQKPTQNAKSQGIHGLYNAVDYTSWQIKYLKRRPEVYAVEDGTVTSGVDKRLGNYIRITSTDGKRRHTFGHLSKFVVKSGKVLRGQLIGIMGYSGYTIPSGVGGTHLHEVYLDLTTNKYYFPPSKVNASFRICTPVSKTVTTTTSLNVRADATSKSKRLSTLKPNTRVKVVALVTGERVNLNNKWYKTADGYIWSGGVK